MAAIGEDPDGHSGRAAACAGRETSLGDEHKEVGTGNGDRGRLARGGEGLQPTRCNAGEYVDLPLNLMTPHVPRMNRSQRTGKGAVSTYTIICSWNPPGLRRSPPDSWEALLPGPLAPVPLIFLMAARLNAPSPRSDLAQHREGAGEALSSSATWSAALSGQALPIRVLSLPIPQTTGWHLVVSHGTLNTPFITL